MRSPVYTVGYEGATVEALIDVLRRSRVGCLIDVRQVPISRKKGFSKNALRAHLLAAGIAYVHIRALGDPKPGRIAARSGRYRQFRRIFSAHLRTPDAVAGLQEARSLAETGSVCLLCFERAAEHCHRTLVANRLGQSIGRFVSPLEVPSAIASTAISQRGRRRGHRPGEGQPAYWP